MTDATTRAGAQSIEISIPRLGQPQHFVKLLGDPKLSLSVRDQDLTRWFGGGSWAVLCVFAAGTVITLTSRTQALRWLGLHWPWLVVVIGAAWLFLLPVGLGGAILAAVGLAVLAWRTRPHRRLV